LVAAPVVPAVEHCSPAANKSANKSSLVLVFLWREYSYHVVLVLVCFATRRNDTGWMFVYDAVQARVLLFFKERAILYSFHFVRACLGSHRGIPIRPSSGTVRMVGNLILWSTRKV